MKWKFVKAVPVTDAKAIVYAFQVTEADFTFSHGFPGREKEKVCALELYGEIYLWPWAIGLFTSRLRLDLISSRMFVSRNIIQFMTHCRLMSAPWPTNLRPMTNG